MELDGGVQDLVTSAVPNAVSAPPPFVPQFWLMLALPLVIFFLVMLVRALPWRAETLAAKPLSCDVCMTGWVSIAMVLGLTWMSGAHWSWGLLHVAPAPGVVLFLLTLHRRLEVLVRDLTPPE